MSSDPTPAPDPEPSAEAPHAAPPERLDELRALLELARVPPTSAPQVGDDSGPSSELLRRLQAHAPASSRYRILGEIGRGGMGAVLRIWDEDLRRHSAMKVVLGSPEAGSGDTPTVDPVTLGRFLEEAQVTGQLDHPGIVPVHELGLGADGRVYFTMRLVKGEDLRAVLEHVKSGHDGWNPTRALGVLLKACEAMAYAHDKHVLHRDLKPANVMVGKYGEVYVMDWGLARVLGQKDRHDLRLQPPPSTQSAVRTERGAERTETPDSPLVTMDGAVMGTPAYMPPEQARGELEALGPHSDVYSMGAMLYELVAGQMPYVPPGARLSPRTILARVLEGPPLPLTEIAPRAPAELVAICEKAMARAPERRYRTMLALAEDLRAYLERRVVKAYESGTWAETRKWVQRNKALAASVAAGILALAGGVATSLLYARDAEAARGDLAQRNEELAATAERERAAAETANRLKNEAEASVREARIRGLIQELEYFDTLDDDVYAYAKKMSRPAHEWWIEGAHRLIDGVPDGDPDGRPWSPGLGDVRAALAALRARARPPTEEELAADRKSHPKAKELETKQGELQWLARILGAEPWPAGPEETLMTEEASSDPNAINDSAWGLVNPAARVFGRELEALELARRAVELAEGEARGIFRDTLAWALLWAGRSDEALAEEARAIEEVSPDKRDDYAEYLCKIEAEARSLRDGTAAARRGALVAEVRALDQAVSERRTFHFDKSEDEWWHDQLVRLEAGLVALAQRLAFAERSVAEPENIESWSEAIAAIAASPHYGGLRLTPQLGLVPIGPDPDSGLWEFAHLATGRAARRGADRRIVLEPEMGLVLVLLPGGRVPVDHSGDGIQDSELTRIDLDPFFLAKYEMTQAQWERIGGWHRDERDSPESGMYPMALLRPFARTVSLSASQMGTQSLLPATYLSWDDCQVALLGNAGWLRLPSEAQWEYGCRAGTATRWWTGNEKGDLEGAANITTKSNGPDIRPVGQLRANDFGLHDVHGNVWEWCSDDWTPEGARRAGDGLPAESGAALRVYRGGRYSGEASNGRSSLGFGFAPGLRNGALGLRPARGITP